MTAPVHPGGERWIVDGGASERVAAFARRLLDREGGT